jgi:hypothetical protein
MMMGVLDDLPVKDLRELTRWARGVNHQLEEVLDRVEFEEEEPDPDE